MTRFFDSRDNWGTRWGMWGAMVLAFLAPLCWWSVRQLRLDNDFEKWLPGSAVEQRSLEWANRQFAREEEILISWDGSSINDPRLENLVERLIGKTDAHGHPRGGLPYVAAVTSPRQLIETLERNGIEPREAIRRLQGTVVGSGPLRLRLTDAGHSSLRKTRQFLHDGILLRYRVEAELREATPDLAALAAIPAFNDDGQPADPHLPAILLADGSFAKDTSLEHDLELTWNGMQISNPQTIELAQWLTQFVPERGDGQPLVESCFFVPGTPVGISIGLSEAGRADKRETVSEIRQACFAAGIPSNSLRLAGSAVTDIEVDDEIRKTAWDPSKAPLQMFRRSVLFSSIVVGGLLTWLTVRTRRLAVMALFLASFSVVLTMSIVAVAGVPLNAVLVILAPLIMAITAGGALHVGRIWEQAASRNPQTALKQAFRTCSRTIIPACLISAAGLAVLVASPLEPVREFGLFAATGTIVGAVVVVFGMLALLELWPPSPRDPDLHGFGIWQKLGRGLTRRPGLQSLVTVAVCVGLGSGLFRTQPGSDLNRLSSHSRIARDARAMETQLTGTMPAEVIIKFDRQAQAELNFLERMELIRKVQGALRGRTQLTGSLSLADFEPVAEIPENETGFFSRTRFNKRATAVEQQFRENTSSNVRIYYTLARQATDLKEAGDGLLNQTGDELWRIAFHVQATSGRPLDAVLTDLHQVCQDQLKLHPGVLHEVTGLLPYTAGTLQLFRETSLRLIVLAGVLMAGGLIFRLRSMAGGLLALLPRLAAIVTACGILAWSGQSFDLAGLVATVVMFTMTLDGSIRTITAFRRALKNGATAAESAIYAHSALGPVILQSRLVLVGGLSLLTLAELPFVSRFGITASVLALAVMAAELILLPQLLAGPLGLLVRPKTKLAVLTEPTPPESAATSPNPSEMQVPAPHFPSGVAAKSIPHAKRDAS